MWLVAGLGNPGDEYEQTRHNVGFMVVDALADRYEISLRQKANNYIYGKGFMDNHMVALIKPFTFMNRSGLALMEAVRREDDIEGIIVIYDDLDLDTAVVRIKNSGASGGHRGVQSIIDSFGKGGFVRLKIGIGRPDRGAAERFVLKRFKKAERPLIDEAVETAADIVPVIIEEGVTYAQNKYHKKT